MKTVVKNVAWSFFGERLLTKAAFGILGVVAKQTDNKLDDKLVAEAKKRYEEKG
ncbi:hypothetical protein [Salinivibrio kushneri]|uniref:hypothetical protein n=1 Tax=Salinivibrio kushneri TaxID=1908198 RepID=UPI001301279D|nr:hypothetical protein [Salinivibrio kushneri]